ncbi:MAG TPA: HPF/RaiA family ribosome-associated protein [Burkholderiales bacterium]|nr:HPF/RaiA family ribosome-associated protein [Burkholderiales bacterium]
MQVPLEITVRGMPHSPALEARIREKAARLEEFDSRIIRCHVMVEESGKHQHQGHRFTVRIDVRVPGREIAVTHEHHEDVFVALRDAFDAAKRQLEDVVREKRGDVKVHVVPQHGRVARLSFDEGFGFIETSDGRELYFSRENVVYPAFERLEPDMPVQFIEEVAGEGPQAKRVSAGKHAV